MAFQPVPNTAAFNLVQTFTPSAGAPVSVLNTVYVQKNTNWNAITLAATGVRIKDRWVSDMHPLQNPKLVLNRVDGRDLTTEFGVISSTASGANGDRVGTVQSTALAALGIYHGAVGAAPRRGRLFIAGINDADVDDNLVSGDYRTALQAALIALQGSIQIIPGETQVLVSRFLNNLPRPSGVTNGIAAIFARDVIATQRDRRS